MEAPSPQVTLENFKHKKLNPYTIKTNFIVIAKFCEWLDDMEFKKFMQTETQLFRNVYHDKVKEIREEDFKQELSMAKGDIRTALVLMGIGGLRFCELATYNGKGVVGKGGKWREIVLPKEFENTSNTNIIYTKLKAALRHNPHDYRSFAATYRLRKGFDIKTVQYILGHSSLQSTERYARPIKGDELKEKENKIWS